MRYAIAKALAAVVVVAGISGSANAQDAAAGYPSKPIRLIVAAPAGGGSDFVGRLLATGIEPELGQKIIVENVAGAGSVAGVTALAKSAPDGYTIGTSNISAVGINPYMQTLPYEPKKDLIAIGLVATNANILVVRSDLPVKSVAELIDYLKKNPNKLNFGSAGVGQPNHLMGELFQMMTGTKMTHVPYKSSPEVGAAMIAGQVDLAFDTAPTYYPLLAGGKVRIIAIASAGTDGEDRLNGLPLVKDTVPEFGAYDQWNGIFAPAGVPRPIVDKLNRAISNYLRSPAAVEAFRKSGRSVLPGTPEQLRDLWYTEAAIWEKVVKSAGIKAE